MSEYSEVELPVVHHQWGWTMKRARMGERRRNEGEIAVRFLRRFVARTEATVTRDPIVSIVDDVADYFVRNLSCLVLDAWTIDGGRRHGLPERLSTEARVVVVPGPDEVPPS